jgi:glycosyltransferase involved in cell wall biosynthesis
VRDSLDAPDARVCGGFSWDLPRIALRSAPVNWRTTCAGVIPCFNEEASIAGVVAGVREFLPSVIVVDDGSSDRTSEQAATSGAQVIRLEANLGKGAALQAGARTALALGFEWMLNLDGDGQHRPTDVPSFLECAARTRASLVIGNRMGQAASLPWVRRFVNRWMSRRLSAYAGQDLADSQCGYRLIKLSHWSVLGLKTQRYEIESELLIASVRAGYQVEFVPVQVIPFGTRSHINPLMDTLRWLKWWNGLERR